MNSAKSKGDGTKKTKLIEKRATEGDVECTTKKTIVQNE